MIRWILTLCISLVLAGVVNAEDKLTPLATHVMMPIVHVSNLEHSTNFYRDVFDLDIALVIPANVDVKDAIEVILTADGTLDPKASHALILMGADERPLPPKPRDSYRTLVITTPDLAAVEARARAAGAEVRDDENDAVGFIIDPDGYRIEVFQF